MKYKDVLPSMESFNVDVCGSTTLGYLSFEGHYVVQGDHEEHLESHQSGRPLCSKNQTKTVFFHNPTWYDNAKPFPEELKAVFVDQRA